MAERLHYQTEHYVLLLPGCGEQFVSEAELIAFLTQMVLEYPESVDRDLEQFGTASERAERLCQTACELAIAPGQTIQWYAVRLEK